MPPPCSRWIRKTVKENSPANALKKHYMVEVLLGVMDLKEHRYRRKKTSQVLP
jgi:hypothetical protein